MKTEYEMANDVIMQLEAVRERPLMYVGDPSADGAWGVVLGLMLGLTLSGYPNIIPRTDAARDTVEQARGWDVSKPRIVQMKGRGMNQAAIFNEIITIEIISIRRRMEFMHE